MVLNLSGAKSFFNAEEVIIEHSYGLVLDLESGIVSVTEPIDPELIDSHKQLKKLDSDALKSLLQTALTELEQSDYTTDDLSNRLNALLTVTHTKPAVLFSLIRIAITQAPASPGLADTLNVLGKEKSLERIKQQIDSL